MIYQYDQALQLPTVDLYDTQMMAMALNAAKDMYEKGEQQIKDFQKAYGDFLTPITADQNWWNQNVTGAARDLVNSIYARGGDPLRNAQDRARISMFLNALPYGEMAKLRMSAENAREYQKEMAKLVANGEFDPDFENFRLNGKNLSNWDTINGGAIWGETSPAKYQDLNKYTGHIFDSIKDSFIRTGPDHYDYYGVTREDRAKALTDHLSGLLKSPLGRFHYENSKAAAERQLGRKLSDQEAMAVWQNDILDATHEYDHENRTLNDIYKLNREHASSMAAARQNNPQQTNQYSIAELIRRTSSTRIVGEQTQEYSSQTLAKQRDAQIKKGLEISKATGGHSSTYKGRQMFKDAYQDNDYSAAVLTEFIANQGFQTADDEINTIIIPKHKINRLSTLGEIQSKTTGFRGKVFDSKPYFRQALKNADEIRVTFTGGNYGAFMKNATNQNHFECIVKVGKKVYNDQGQYKYEWTPIGTESQYFDSHITSKADDPRTGYLGTVDKKGKITETPGLPITNTQDTKYQDAVASDVYTTSKYVKGSDYNYDAPYTELTSYPYTTKK